MLLGLMYYAFYPENRKIIADKGGIQLVMTHLQKYGSDKDLVKETLSLIWNIACDLDVRKTLNKTNIAELIVKVKDKHYKNEEVNEVADVTLRSLKKEQGTCMDPLVEKCIIKDACTFSVTGNTTYLLQVWYDCFTCNLRSNFGICQSCAIFCHNGHQLSAPKFGRFFCDCGHGEAYNTKKKGVPCGIVKKVEDLGLKRKREKDEDYRKEDSDDDPDPLPLPFPMPLPFPFIQPNFHQTTQSSRDASQPKPKIATLFNT